MGLKLAQLCLRHTHHAQHVEAACAEEPYQQHGSENQERDVEDGSVVPLDAFGDGYHTSIPGDDTQHAEQKLHDVAGSDHGHVEGGKDVEHHTLAIVAPVNVQ